MYFCINFFFSWSNFYWTKSTFWPQSMLYSYIDCSCSALSSFIFLPWSIISSLSWSSTEPVYSKCFIFYVISFKSPLHNINKSLNVFSADYPPLAIDDWLSRRSSSSALAPPPLSSLYCKISILLFNSIWIWSFSFYVLCWFSLRPWTLFSSASFFSAYSLLIASSYFVLF